ncbi:MAG: hypothetical protein A2622_04125 [Bdellovibrionales bacterium RIFCSPHIGHO2_01_FULL_40_29]|nr:MAG: hypothetical protein A2622_04125 [Bdellovibrionales bacterium RIFCSPHIGHO2_01_FULL_40_29]OFZ34875.1 MAG: hypothetical protein A3D17_11250 [Bdellovibrionales bacterium RIFCSPHIGHO2_02_FULL_40_15]
MKRTISFWAILLGMCLMAESAFAVKNLWRQCGIGGMIFRETGWAAITSNIIWDLGTTATTSEISSDGLCEGKAANTAEFINTTYANLEEETAVGSGPHLETMLDIVGCDQAVRPVIIESLRNNLKSEISTVEYSKKSKSEKAESYYNGFMNNIANHAKACPLT